MDKRNILIQRPIDRLASLEKRQEQQMAALAVASSRVADLKRRLNKNSSNRSSPHIALSYRHVNSDRFISSNKLKRLGNAKIAFPSTMDIYVDLFQPYVSKAEVVSNLFSRLFTVPALIRV